MMLVTLDEAFFVVPQLDVLPYHDIAENGALLCRIVAAVQKLRAPLVIA
jgi:hypothetical protein